jgi:hypothetical protein
MSHKHGILRIVLELFPPMTEPTIGKQILAGDARANDSIDNRLDEAGFFVPPSAAHQKYMRIHKRLVGPRTVDTLLSIHSQLASASDVEYLSVAGWAAAEAALVATDRGVEDRLGYLGWAACSWDDALLYQEERNMQRGLPESYPHANINRLQLARLFIPLMKGMVMGDVTKQIRETVYNDLLLLAAQNAYGLVKSVEDGLEEGGYIGLAHEINAMLAVNRLKSPTLIAMSAIARADSGEFYPEKTHDIELLHLNRGKILDVTTLESKARPRERHYKRYEAAIIHGRIHLYTKTGTSPVETVELFLKEHDSNLTAAETEELEEMTDTIVHLARHQLSEVPHVSPHCRDVKECDAVPRHRSLRVGRSIVAVATQQVA